MAIMRALQAINTGKVLTSTAFEPDIRYVWIDEDGKPVRELPFPDFGKALTWYQNWNGRKVSLTTQLERLRGQKNPVQWQIDRCEEQLEKMPATSKPPVKLLRVMIRASVEPISSAEAKVVRDVITLQSRIKRAG